MLTLEVQNFGPIKKADIRLCPLNVFIGPNNAGKSYLATLTYAFRHLFGHSSSEFLFRFEWEMLEKPEIQDAQMALSRWRQQWAQDRKDFKVDQLPVAAQKNLAKVANSFFGEIPKLLTREVQRCFAAELNDMARPEADGACKLIVKQPNPLLELDMAVSDKRFKLLRKKVDFRNAAISYAETEHSPTFVVSRLILGEVVRASAYYLPAARSGILQGHKLLAGILLSRIPLLGIEELNIPRLSGIIADFISNLLYLERTQESKSIGHIAEFLEKEVCKGKIEKKLVL